MSDGLTEEEELELLQLQEAEALAAANDAPADVTPAEVAEEPGIAGRAWDAATTPLPGLGALSDAVRTDIPGAIAEKAGELAPGEDIASKAVRAAGVGHGAAIGMAGEVIPRSVLDIGLLAVGGPLGRGAGKMAMKALPPLEARAPNVVKAVKAALSADILPTVAQITQSRPAAALEEIASKIPYFGRRIEAMRAVQDSAYHELRGRAITGAGSKLPGSELGAKTQAAVADDLAKKLAEREVQTAKLHAHTLKKFGPSKSTEQIGQELDEILVQKVDQEMRTSAKLYGIVDEAIPPASNHVYDGNMKNFAEKTLEKYEKKALRKTIDPDILKRLEDIKAGPGEQVIENAANPAVKWDAHGLQVPAEAVQLLKQRKAYTFGEMTTLRANINGKIHQMQLAGKKVEAGIYREMKKALDLDIKSFSDGLEGSVKKKFDTATAFYRDHFKAIYGNETIEPLLSRSVKNNLEDTYKMLIEPGDVNDIRRLKRAVGETGFAPVRRKFVEGLITGPEGQILGGQEITRKMAKYGPETMREVFSPEQMRQIAKYAETREMPKFIETEMERKLRGLIYQSKGVYRAPEDVVARVVDGDVATLRAVKNIVGREGVKPYKRAIIENILGSAPEPLALPGQAVTPTSLRIGKNLQAYDENFLKEIFTKPELDDIEKIDNIKALMESQQFLNANRSGTSSSLIANMATGSGITLAFLNPLKTVPVVIGMDVLTRLYTSEAGRKLLIKGLDPKFARNTEVAGRLAAIIAQVQREKVNEDRALAGAVRK